MPNFAIGISGLNAAQAALDIIGNNIANAATDGYHRQRVELVPAPYGRTEAGSIGEGVNVAGVTRLIDGLLEREITRQESAYGQVAQELSILGSVETTLGEFTEGSGLNAMMDAFFNALQSLAAHPLERVWRNQTLSTAEALANEFRRLGAALTTLEDQIVLEARNTGDTINALITEIAELNEKIQALEVSQGPANNLRDQRDHLITELAKLTGIEVQYKTPGIADVSIGGFPVVTEGIATPLEVGLLADRSLGVAVSGFEGTYLDIQGGRLGGLLTLKNGSLAGLRVELDTLAKAIMDQVNQCHAQGLGVEGSFTELTGWLMADTDLAVDGGSITDGTFYLRLTNTATGEVQRHAIDVDVSSPTPDTLDTIAAKVDGIAGLNASVVSSRLHIVADAGYTFDFLPAVLSEPTAANLTAPVPPAISVSGIYTGAENQIFTFTVVGSGSVGNGALQINVTNEDGDVLDTLNVGAGYAAGDTLALANGIKISVGVGALNAGDGFEVAALATSDTSGFLAAAGMNAFFSGSTASDMRVCNEIFNAPDRIATAFGRDLTDNAAALRLADIRDTVIGSLDGVTPGQYYHRTIADLAQQIALKQSRRENIEAVIQNLEKKRSEISSVNINDEAAQLLVFEKMFQAMAKYLGTLQTTMTSLMDIL